MKKILFVASVLFSLVAFVLADGALAAANKMKLNKMYYNSNTPISDGAMPIVSSKNTPYVDGVKYYTNCLDIAPEVGTMIELTQIGSTWYDFQQNGSMGRMIAVTSDGYREDSWMYCTGVYPGVGRYIRANQETPANVWISAINADGGTGINSGYSNQSYLDSPGADNGASVLSFYRTGGTPTWYTTLCVDDEAGGNFFTRKFDVPDYITGSTSQSEWPKAEVKYDASAGKDYIHIVGTEGSTASGVPVMVTYVRCYIKNGPGLLDTLVCQCYNQGAPRTYQVVAGANGGGAFSTISNFDSSCSITPVPVCSRISGRVAVAWLRPANCNLSANHCDFLSDVCFIESMNSGQDWVDGTNWPPPEYNTTNYGYGGTERGFRDLNACYDFQDSLHIVYVTAGFDSTNPGYYQPGVARLYHWSKKDGISMIVSKIQEGTAPGASNINIAKMNISALNPTYHPGGSPDSVYLYATWTQFDSSDISSNGFSNGDLFGCGSNTGGATWGGVYNLTNTPTPNCAAGSCLSEHWSSLAQNMYNGDLHIQYVCDRDAGGAIQDAPSQWMDNPMMYLRLSSWPIDAVPRVSYHIVDLDSWYGPPLKVTPNGTRTLKFKVNNIGNANLVYSVNTDNSCITCNVSPTVLAPRDSATVSAEVHGSGACNGTFIDGNIHLLTNDTANADIQMPVQAVAADDYVECPRDSNTHASSDNGKMKVRICCNGQVQIDDKTTFPDITNVYYNGGNYITWRRGDKEVLRYMGQRNRFMDAQKLVSKYSSSYYDTWYTWDVYGTRIDPPVKDKRWFGWKVRKEVLIYKNNASDNLKNSIIMNITVYQDTAPAWYPDHKVLEEYEDTYIGMVMDIDCPSDTLDNREALNAAGYDYTNDIAWQHGKSFGGEHPEYDEYYAGIALAQGTQPGESTVPYGGWNVRNDVYLYPQGGWGWVDSLLYNLAETNGIHFQDPDSIVDRTWVLSARKINAGSDPHARASFTVIATIAPDGFTDLQDRIAAAREWVSNHPLILCGDVNNDGDISVGDIVVLINYLFKGSDPSTIAGPIERADCNSSESVEVGDIITLINYLYKGYPASTVRCPGVW